MVIDESVTFDKIICCMDAENVVDPVFRNGHNSEIIGLETSHWVAGVPTGLPCRNLERGTVTYIDSKSHRLRRVLRQNRRDEIWRSTPMNVRLTKEELSSVPGLADFVIQRK